jgi:hypothetical protein
MANRVQQDSFIDDSDDTWYVCASTRTWLARGFQVDSGRASPLCVEEFDLSDRNFRPCPCGYQVRAYLYINLLNSLKLPSLCVCTITRIVASAFRLQVHLGLGELHF